MRWFLKRPCFLRMILRLCFLRWFLKRLCFLRMILLLLPLHPRLFPLQDGFGVKTGIF